jgi:hypothetical protein
MAESWLRSYAISAPEPVPWGWNPAATFQKAYDDAQENRRAQEEFEMGKTIEQILFPLKVQKAQIELEKLVQDRDRTMLVNEQLRQGRRIADQGIKSAVTGSGDNSYGPFGSMVTTPQPTQQAPVGTLGSGLTPTQ